jgi:hypothetical protein
MLPNTACRQFFLDTVVLLHEYSRVVDILVDAAGNFRLHLRNGLPEEAVD